jgi:hypothetical protein
VHPQPHGGRKKKHRETIELRGMKTRVDDDKRSSVTRMKEWDGEKEDEPEQQIQPSRAHICTNDQRAQSGESDDEKTSACFRNGDRKGKA